MNTYHKVAAEMDRLISENEALAYRLPMPPDEVTDNNQLQVTYARVEHALPELQPLNAKLDSVSKVEVLMADAKLKPVSVCDVLTNPALPAFQVCVMLTKLQLNDLQQSLKLIVDAARKTQTSPKDFFQEIASASAYMSRDPQALRKGGNLADGGILGEYLEGLPYRSKSLNMTQDLWLSLSVAEQEDFIDELESKIRLYETFHNDIANWVRFGAAQPGDALYRVPLATLP